MILKLDFAGLRLDTYKITSLSDAADVDLTIRPPADDPKKKQPPRKNKGDDDELDMLGYLCTRKRKPGCSAGAPGSLGNQDRRAMRLQQ